MHKTVIKPGMWGEIDAEVGEPQMSYGVVTDRGDHRHVRFSGGIHPEGSLAEQVRTVLGHRRDALTDLGGSMSDVTTARYYVLADRLDRETQGRIHEVRAEFYRRSRPSASGSSENRRFSG